jgi:folate-binding protein YgfZ
MNTALQTAISKQPESAAHPVSLSDYRGATTAARFRDPQSELFAMFTGCAVRDLAPDHGVYAFLLNPQGHILADMYVYNRGETLLVDTDRSQIEKIIATFDHYIIMDDVELGNLGEQLTAIGVTGPKARATMRAAAIEVPDLQPLQLFELRCDCECGCVECTIVRRDDPQRESYEIWLSPAHVKPLWESLLAAGATPVGAEALEMHRILSGIPLYGADIRERDLPQETEQTRALNFNKGCYIGQEIVERIRSRGSVHRTFMGFVSRTEGQISRGAKVFLAEKEAGEITSATSLHQPESAWTVALGYIRRERLSGPGTETQEVTINGAKARVVELPMRDAPFLRGMEKSVAEVGTPAAR